VTEQGDSDVDPAEASHEPRECMPCRGSGRVISNLGGTPNMVTCPWCGGSGRRLPEVNAQAKWLEGDASAGSEPA
jgi:DnaJ-class molecular chaperone